MHLTGSAILAHRTRSLLTGLGIAVGIAAVVLLTAIGEGVQRFVVHEFTQFGTNLIAISPGKTQTFGLSGAMVSNVRPLSLDDAAALAQLPQVLAVVPFVQGNAAVEANGRTRRAAPGAPRMTARARGFSSRSCASWWKVRPSSLVAS